MLRTRSRTVTGKQALMPEQNSVTPSPRPNFTPPISSFFNSPRFFNGFLAKVGVSDSETIRTPTSILDCKRLSNLGKPFGYDQNLTKPPKFSTETKQLNEKLNNRGLGLALIDSHNDQETSGNFTKANSRKVMLGSKLKIQVPPLPSSAISPTQSPKSPADFGIKTRNSLLLGNSSPFQRKDYSPKISTGGMSLKEMELSEEYTCVISHGPNPRTTRIYENCVVESCCGGGGGGSLLSELEKDYNLKSPCQNFLSFCCTCKENLGEGKDIYMYRGEKAFCSHECRCEEILLDGLKNSEMDNAS